MNDSVNRLDRREALDLATLADLEEQFEDAYHAVSFEAVERATGGRSRALTIELALGVFGTFTLEIAVPDGDERRTLDYNNLFGTTEGTPETSSRLRGLYLQGRILESGQPVRLVRMNAGNMHLLPLA